MLQRVGFPVGGSDVEGILHLPDGETVGGAAVFGGRDGHNTGAIPLCEALAAGGVAALRFAFPLNADLATGFAYAAPAIRLLRAHPAVPQRIGVVGHSYGAAVAALAAGRDSRIRATALICPPAERPYFGTLKPIAELSRTRSRVLVVVAGRDEVVAPADADRYAAVLLQARVTHRVERIELADHLFSDPALAVQMHAAVVGWMRESLA